MICIISKYFISHHCWSAFLLHQVIRQSGFYTSLSMQFLPATPSSHTRFIISISKQAVSTLFANFLILSMVFTF